MSSVVRRPSPLAVAGVVALLGLVAGCGGFSPTGVKGADRTACEALVKALPAKVDGHQLVKRDSDVPGATYGDPAIVLRCGVGKPEDYDPVAQCLVTHGIGWFVPAKGMNDQSVDVVMTAISRTPAVEVTIPAKYRPPVGTMVDLSASIRAHTKATGRCPG